MRKIIFAILSVVLFSASSYAQQEEKKINLWVYKKSTEISSNEKILLTLDLEGKGKTKLGPRSKELTFGQKVQIIMALPFWLYIQEPQDENPPY